MDRDRLCASYDSVASEYARRIGGELAGKPLDREILDRFAAEVRDAGIVLDVGCGPGHVARYLRERGARVVGVDLSPAMIDEARALAPGVDFRVGDMSRLDDADASCAGIVAFYSIVHVPKDEMVAVLSELRRVLRPGAPLVLAFHVGSEVVHRDELWERPVDLDWYCFTSDEVTGWLVEAGFAVLSVVEREPYPDVEHPSRRSYVRARRPTIE